MVSYVKGALQGKFPPKTQQIQSFYILWKYKLPKFGV